MKPTSWIACGAILAGLAVGAGAFGAHGLKSRYKSELNESPESRLHADAVWRLDVFDTAARYQMYHSLAVIASGLLAARRSTVCSNMSGLLFVIGIAVFSGCLYALALGGPRELGRVVPFGGGAFIAGWICLAIGAFRVGADGQSR